MVKLPKPTNEILDLFKNQESLTPKQISSALTHFEKKDIKYALRRLREKGIIVRVPNLFDMRRVYYRVATQDEFQSVSVDMNSHEIEFFQAIMDNLLFALPREIEAEIN
jgi:predicted transcriptional regulator